MEKHPLRSTVSLHRLAVLSAGAIISTIVGCATPQATEPTPPVAPAALPTPLPVPAATVSPASPTSANIAEDADLAAVRRVVAKELNEPIGNVRAETTLGDLGARDIEVVQVELAVESDRGVTIDDDALERLVKAKDQDKMTQLTVGQLAELVRASR